MPYHLLRPRQALNKAFLKLKTARAEMEAFKACLRTLLDSLNLHETEEHAKNILRDFLKGTHYEKYGINTKGRTDLVIHTGASTKSNAGVLLEVKRPGARAEMPTTGNLNAKATQELLLYYLRERVQLGNHDLRHLVITDVHEWFVFDALEFDRLLYRNTQLRKDFTDWSEGRKASTGTDFFYKTIAAPALAQLTPDITFTHFNLKEYEKPLRNHDLKDDVKLVALYKLLSPPHLLKEAFANDANSLDRGFYQELLHIIGLEEVKEGGRKLIQRRAKPHPGSLLEAAYQKLRSEDLVQGLENPYSFGSTREEQLFNVALELCITWINRILFLKLLEAQLISYHHGDRRYAFMSTDNLREFDDLNELFFDVLAERPELRGANVRQKYSHIPYLNSSLFETTPLERRTLRISNLRDRSHLPLLPQTIFKRTLGQAFISKTQELPTLEYLLRFLGSYDFGAEGKEEIQEENKTLITASVLGLIFEKINGYRDGSFYTPGFITMYMSREAIRRAVVQRFSETYGWDIDTAATGQAFEALQLHIHRHYSVEKLQEYNRLLNSLRICDPAVGSGHYLVSALNELLVVKAELGILLNRQGKLLRYGSLEVQNDELIITDNYGELFSYTVQQQPDGRRSINPQVQELQEALFHEKQTIIENCLFGVDINPNSVKICRLRLWIELLKNAYYCQNPDSPDDGINQMTSNAAAEQNKSHASINLTHPNSDKHYTHLQTLPNIDINIKQGNSLLSRYPLSADLHEAFGRKGHSLQAYREAVASYKHTNSKEDKKRLTAFLEEIKQGFRTTLANNDPMRQRMAKLRGTIAVMQDPDLFGKAKPDKTKLAKLQKELKKLEEERTAIETNKVYQGAFEWRFEFPEVLDEEGNYRGFDVVIGNPPYISNWDLSESNRSLVLHLEKEYREILTGHWDLFACFVFLGYNLIIKNGYNTFILPTSFLKEKHSSKIREFLIEEVEIINIVDFGERIVFDDVARQTCIYLFKKNKKENSTIDLFFGIDENSSKVPQKFFLNLKGSAFKTSVNEVDITLYYKLNSGSTLLGNLVCINTGVVAHSRVGSPIKFTKDDVIFKEYKEGYKKYIVGSNIIPYHVNFQNDFIDYDNNREFFHRPKYPLLFDNEKIVIRRISGKNNRFMAIYDNQGYYSNDNLMHLQLWYKELLEFQKPENKWDLILNSNLNLRYILAIVNSKLNTYFFSKFLSTDTLQGSYSSIYPEDIRQIPIKIIDTNEQVKFVNIVEQIITTKQANPAADTTALEAEIDLLVYRLYDLSYEEVLLVEPGFALSRELYEAAQQVPG